MADTCFSAVLAASISPSAAQTHNVFQWTLAASAVFSLLKSSFLAVQSELLDDVRCSHVYQAHEPPHKRFLHAKTRSGRAV